MIDFIGTTEQSLRDKLILVGTGLPCLFLLPFSLYRFLTGDFALGAIDLLISLGLILLFYQAWHSKEVKYLNLIAVMGFMLSVCSVMYLRGLSMVFWGFPAIVFSYFVLKSRMALFMNALFIAGLTYIFFNTLTLSQALSIYPSLILVCLFGYVFSVCAEIQNKSLLELVSIDTLTGIKNRRAFDLKVDEILAENRRIESSKYLLLLDLDFFKTVNDSYGHKQGDQVLIDFTRTVEGIIRKTDYLYRIGGEEFAVITSSTSLKNVEKFADVVREKIQSTPSLSKFKLTVSIGVSQVSFADSADCWFKRTDLALYQAKSRGRNRVWVAELDKEGEIHFSSTKQATPVKVPLRSVVIDKQSKDTGIEAVSANGQKQVKEKNIEHGLGK